MLNGFLSVRYGMVSSVVFQLHRYRIGLSRKAAEPRSSTLRSGSAVVAALNLSIT